MNIIDIKHHEQKTSNKVKSEFKMISNTAAMTEKSYNIHPAKVISIAHNGYGLSYSKNLQHRFSSEEHIFSLNEFLHKDTSEDHVMFLKNFCS